MWRSCSRHLIALAKYTCVYSTRGVPTGTRHYEPQASFGEPENDDWEDSPRYLWLWTCKSLPDVELKDNHRWVPLDARASAIDIKRPGTSSNTSCAVKTIRLSWTFAKLHRREISPASLNCMPFFLPPFSLYSPHFPIFLPFSTHFIPIACRVSDQIQPGTVWCNTFEISSHWVLRYKRPNEPPPRI